MCLITTCRLMGFNSSSEYNRWGGQDENEKKELASEMNIGYCGPEDWKNAARIDEFIKAIKTRAFLLPGLDCGKCECKTCKEMAKQILAGNKSLMDWLSINVDLKVTINGNPIALSPFIVELIKQTFGGFIKSLKGVVPGNAIIELPIEPWNNECWNSWSSCTIFLCLVHSYSYSFNFCNPACYLYFTCWIQRKKNCSCDYKQFLGYSRGRNRAFLLFIIRLQWISWISSPALYSKCYDYCAGVISISHYSSIDHIGTLNACQIYQRHFVDSWSRPDSGCTLAVIWIKETGGNCYYHGLFQDYWRNRNDINGRRQY